MSILTSILLAESVDKGGPGSGPQGGKASTQSEHQAAYQGHMKESERYARAADNAPHNHDAVTFRRLSDNHALAGSLHRVAATTGKASDSQAARTASVNTGKLR